MPMLTVLTQVHENYGAHDWDGKGECPSYWKAKGGCTYDLGVITWAEAAALGQTGLRALVDKACAAGLEQHDDYTHEYVIDWALQDEGFTDELGDAPIDFWLRHKAIARMEEALALTPAKPFDEYVHEEVLAAMNAQASMGGD
jgi:hypothetical protein